MLIDDYVARVTLESVCPAPAFVGSNMAWMCKPFALDGHAVASDLKGVLAIYHAADRLGLAPDGPTEAQADVMRRAINTAQAQTLGWTTLREAAAWAGRDVVTLDVDGDGYRETVPGLIGAEIVDRAALAAALWPLALAGDCSIRVMVFVLGEAAGMPYRVVQLVGEGWILSRMALVPDLQNMPAAGTARLTLREVAP
jgi:hypothetical protein